jgi:hypothetical protein
MSQSISHGCPECSHIMPGGRKCGAVALKGQLLCHAHTHRRRLVEINRVRRHSVALPPLEDRAAIQMAIDEVLAAFAGRKITRRETATYLYAIDLAARNLTRIEQLPPPYPPQPSNDEPGAPGPGAPGPGAPGPSLLGTRETPSPAPRNLASDNRETASRAPAEPFPGRAAHPSAHPPLPAPASRNETQATLQRYRQAHAHYAAMPSGTATAMLDQIQTIIDSLEAELASLNQQHPPARPPEGTRPPEPARASG